MFLNTVNGDVLPKGDRVREYNKASTYATYVAYPFLIGACLSRIRTAGIGQVNSLGLQPLLRDRLAALQAEVAAMKYNGMRILSDKLKGDEARMLLYGLYHPGRLGDIDLFDTFGCARSICFAR